MQTVLTLVANQDHQEPFGNIVEAAKASLHAMRIEQSVLKPGHAIDLYFNGYASDVDVDAFSHLADYCIQPTENRRKKLLLADMDSTIITVECIDELADYAGIKKEVSEITEKAMRGELDFNDAFRARVAMLKGLDESVLDQTFEERIKLMPGARTMIQTMKAHGAYTALVSGGFTYFTAKIRDIVGFDMDDANTLLFENGKLTGNAQEPILNSQAKLANLNRLKLKLDLETEETAAIGDGANDIPMIEAAGLGVAYHAKPKAQEAANATIRFNDLTTLLYYQGYKESEFKA